MNTFLTKYINVLIMVFIMIFIGALYSTKNFQLDASSDTLILENDQDLNNYREVIKEYSSKDFLLITITSKSKIVINKNIIFIKNLSDEISKLKWVDSVQSILDIPILKSGNQSLTDLTTRQLTLRSSQLDLMEIEKEFIESPIFSQLVISKDGKSSGIIITIKDDNEFINIVEKRSSLKKILNPSSSIKNELRIIEKKYNELKKDTDLEREKNIEEI